MLHGVVFSGGGGVVGVLREGLHRLHHLLRHRRREEALDEGQALPGNPVAPVSQSVQSVSQSVCQSVSPETLKSRVYYSLENAAPAKKRGRLALSSGEFAYR